MSAEPAAVYLDSSALVKLVVAEPETPALQRYLAQHAVRFSCALARVEVVRAVRPHGPQAVARAGQVLCRIHLLQLDEMLLDAAADLDPEALRSLDAIHIAAARTVGASLEALVTYDARMTAAARAGRVPTAAPAP